MSDERPVIFDEDNPEWTDEDFAKARPISDFPHLAAAFPKSKGGRPKGSNKVQVALRLDRDAIERFKADGPGWQSRINEAVRKAAGL
jgi:uncharacterized protein (DUF4415 family)